MVDTKKAGVILAIIIVLAIKNTYALEIPNEEYFYIFERIIKENQNYFDVFEHIISSDINFQERIREIHLEEGNFSSIERFIIIYHPTDNDNDQFLTYNDEFLNNNNDIDCNDNNPNIYPGAKESCNGLDDDCDGEIDENACECNNGVDDDKDGLIDNEDPGCWDDIRLPKSYNPLLTVESRAEPECSKNSDCGSDRFTGSYYCISNKIYRNYIYYACSNKGLGNAECSRTILPELINSCSFGCNNGFCTSPENLFEEVKTDLFKTVELNPSYVRLKNQNPLQIFLKNLAIGVVLEAILVCLLLKKRIVV